MVECEIKTCRNEANKVRYGIKVCSLHYKNLDECEDPKCKEMAILEFEGMKVCQIHFEKYKKDKEKAQRISLDKKLDEVLDKLYYVHMVIKNLKNREGNLLFNVAEADKRLFSEIAKYVLLTDQLKKDFIILLLEDAKRLAQKGINNMDLYDQSADDLKQLLDLLNSVIDHENKDISFSSEVKELSKEGEKEIGNLLKEMEENFKTIDEEKNRYNKTQSIHRFIR